MKRFVCIMVALMIIFSVLTMEKVNAGTTYSYTTCPKCNQQCLFTETSNLQYRGTSPPIPIVYTSKTWQCSAYMCRLYMLKFNSDCLGCGGYGKGNCLYLKEYIWPFGYSNTRLDLCYNCNWRYSVSWWSQS